MRSYRIMQLLNDSQADENNQSQALTLYNSTVTDDNGQVYSVASDNTYELADIVYNLSFENFTWGGECLTPTANLFNHSDCLLNQSNGNQVWNTTIIFDVCNATRANNEKIFALLTSICAVAVTPNDNDNNDNNVSAYLYAISLTSFLLTGLMFGLMGGLYYFSRNDRERPDNYSWLRRRARENEANNTAIIEEFKDDEPDGNEALYDPVNAQQRNAAGYAQLSTRP